MLEKIVMFFFKKNNFLKIFDFRCFRKNNVPRKNKDVSKIFSFYVFIISHVQPLRVASRNSPCAVRGRGKRPPENPKNFKNPPTGLTTTGFALIYVH